jgi:hypothetical protein
LTDDPTSKLSINIDKYLELNTEVEAGTYNYTYKVVLSGDDNYNSKEVNDKVGQVSVIRTDIPESGIVVTAPSLPNDIVYGYTTKTSDSAFDITGLPGEYRGTPSYVITSNPSNKLRIDDDNHLVLDPDINAGTHDFTYKVVLPEDRNYGQREITNLPGSFSVSKANLPSSGIIANAPSLSATYNYANNTTSNNPFSISGKPGDYNGTQTYTITSQSPGTFLSINSDNKLVLASGSNAGTINYDYKVKLNQDTNYDEREYTGFNSSVTINRATLPDFQVKISGGSTVNPVEVGYSQQIYPLTNTCAITGTSFTYSKTAGDPKITVAGSNLTVLTGLSKGQYSVSIKCTATNNNYNNKDSSILTFTFYVSGPNDLLTSNGSTALASSYYTGAPPHGPA